MISSRPLKYVQPSPKRWGIRKGRKDFFFFFFFHLSYPSCWLGRKTSTQTNTKLNKCAVLRIVTLTGGPLCRENHPLCRLKNPTVVYMTSCRLSSWKTDVHTVHLLIILERGCSSMYRKKEIDIKIGRVQRTLSGCWSWFLAHLSRRLIGELIYVV